MSSKVYLIPCPIAEDAVHTLSPQVLDSVKLCHVFFVENERSARRFLKKIWREMVIDHYQWFVIEDEQSPRAFREQAKQGRNIGIISEAGCPGIADPGQSLVAIAQEMMLSVVPLVGPSSILLALMASGLNGQHFCFHGYLPIDNLQRVKALKELESETRKKGTTHIFIETPYRNNQMFSSITANLQSDIRLCVAVDITGPSESIRTMPLKEWKKQVPELHKKTVIFLIGK
ncbi:MAG TPA: SAM-dependent methyltransferase [Chitinophagaceae bacterium]|nr:SAM-dependent methyltransferase [Chitinophagaceae bacterium]